MYEIMEKVKVLFDTLVVKNKAVDELKAEFETKIKKVDERIDIISKATKDLDSREARTSKVENVLALEEKANSDIKKCEDESKKLVKEKSVFDVLVKEKNDALSRLQESATKSKEKYDNMVSDLGKEWTKIREEKKNLKETKASKSKEAQ